MSKVKIAISKALVAFLAFAMLVVMSPIAAQAAALTAAQQQAILDLLSSFGADAATIANVNSALNGQATTGTGSGSSSCGDGYVFTTFMKRGSSGAEVKKLQEVLNANGHSVGTADGSFGPKTDAGVKAFQASKGLVADGLVGANTRTALNVLTAVSCPPVDPGTGPTPPVVTGGTFSASVGATNPASGSVVAGQAAADLAHFTFSNGMSTAANVTNLSFTQTGISNDSTLAKVYLFEGATRLTDSATVSSSKINFNQPSGLFSVPANSARTVAVRADITSGTSGQTVGVRLDSFTYAGGSAMATSLSSNLHTVATATLAGVDFATTTTPSAASVSAAPDMVVWQNNVTISTRKVRAHAMQFRLTGSAEKSQITNWRLYIDGVQAGSAVAAPNANGYVVFDLSASPVSMETGTRQVKVVADASGKVANDTLAVQIRQAADALFYDTQVNVPVLATANSSTFSARTAGTQTFNSGSLIFQKKSDSPSGTIVNAASSATLGTFTVTASGESVKVDSLRVAIAEDDGDTAYTLRNGALFLNGVQVGSTTSIASDDDATLAYTEYTFGSSFIVNPGSPATLEIRADVYDDDGTNDVAANDTIQVTINAGSANAEGTSSLVSLGVPTAAVSGNTLTVGTGSLTLYENTSYADRTTTVPQTAYKIASFNLQADTTEGSNITSIVVDATSTADAFDMSSDTANLYIKVGTSYTSNIIASPADTDNTFNTNVTLAAGQSAEVAVYADVLSSATDGDGTADTVTIGLDVTHTTLGSATTLTHSQGGQTITFGTGSFASALDGTSPLAKIVAGNQTAVAAAYKFTATNETYTISELQVKVGSAAIASVINSVQFYVNGSPVGGSAPFVLSSGTAAKVTGLSIPVPSNGSVIVEARLALNNIGTGAGTSQSNAALTLDSVKYTAASDGSQTTDGTDRAGNALYVYKSIPTVNHVDLINTTALINGSARDIYKFTVTADSNGPVHLKQFVLTTSWDDGGSTDTLEMESVKLFEDGVDVTTNVVIQDEDGNSVESTSGLLEADEDLVVSWATGNESTIGAGATKTYVVRATPQGFRQTGSDTQGDYVSFNLAADSAHNGTETFVNGTPTAATLWGLNDSATATGDVDTALAEFIWSDDSAAPHANNENASSSADWANGFKVKNLDLPGETWGK